MQPDSTNPYARPYACPRCLDSRVVTRHASARKDDLVPCDRCGLLSTEAYDLFRRDAWIKAQVPPEICELDLTPEEFETFTAFRQQHPNTSKKTILTWIEGQRYDPAKDAEFLAEARQKFKEWKHR